MICYSNVRNIVSRSICGKSDSIDFSLDMNKMNRELEKYNMKSILYKSNFNSKHVEFDDVILLSEYYKFERMDWFDYSSSYISFIILVEDDTFSGKYINMLSSITNVNEEYSKRLKSICSLVSNCSCINCVICKKIRDNGSISINIRFRANQVLLSNS